MVVWTIIGGFAVAAGGLIGYVTWRDRRRGRSGDDAAASAEAQSQMDRFVADREAAQGLRWTEGMHGDGH